MDKISESSSILADTGSLDVGGSNSDFRPFDLKQSNNETVIKRLANNRRRFRDFEDLTGHLIKSKRFREEDSLAVTEPAKSQQSKSPASSI